jgi:hypothetical protein
VKLRHHYSPQFSTHKEHARAHPVLAPMLLTPQFDAIVLCFLNSAVPPRIHVDIPEDMASAIIEKGEARVRV